MSKKIVLKDVQTVAKEKGYEVLDNEYIAIKTKMHFKCMNCGYVYESSFDNFKNKKCLCPICNREEKYKNNRRYTFEKMNNFSLQHNIKVIESDNKGVKSKCVFECLECGTKFNKIFQHFLENPSCPDCRINSRMTTYEEAKYYVEVESNSGCKFLCEKEEYYKKRKEEPKMALCKFDFQCKCGNIFTESLNAFKTSKQQCNKCTYGNRENQKYTYEQVKQYIELDSNSGCKLISQEYKNYHEPLELQCSCGNHFFRALAEFKGGKLFKCPQCTGATVKYTYEQVEDELKENDIILLSKEYINYESKMLIKYNKCGHEAERSLSNIRRSDYSCPYCNKKGYNRDTEVFKKEIEEIANGEYELISEYKTMNDSVIVKHKLCGNEYKVTPHNFLDSGNRCPICYESKGEQFLRHLFDNKNIFYTAQYSFNDLKGDYNLLRFDFAVFEDEDKTKLKFLVEYDGEFHYIPILSNENLQRQQRYDKLKDEYCKNNQIKLVRIPYWEFDNIENIISKNN